MMKFETMDASFELDSKGTITAIIAKYSQKNYITFSQPSPIIQIQVKNQLFSPDNVQFNTQTNQMVLNFNSPAVTVTIQVNVKYTHICFEIVEIEPKPLVDVIVWGPYAITINDIVGEIIGVARNKEFSVGIQSLNPKTVGSSLDDEQDTATNGIERDDHGKYQDIPVELTKVSLFRGNTAWPTEFGCILQMFCRNRDQDRIISNWGQPKYVAPAYHDGGLIGSKIALFACRSEKSLDTIGEIELSENLPHPTIDGIWAKKSPLANASYLIVDFGENNIDQAIDLAKRAGLKGLYHSSPFASWGHFNLGKNMFPNGIEGFKNCVDRARQEGIHVGIHTLSNFTTPTDSYVSPKPDPRLGKIGSSIITEDIDSNLEEIPIENPEFFMKDTELNTVVIGEELIHYMAVSKTSPWKLLECERGEWGTKASAHKKGDTVGKLADHGYKVFLTNAELSIEEAKNIAEFCNKTGVMRLSMDGLEGNLSTGLGQYGRVLFADTWYNALSPQLKGFVRNDASCPAHFNWHINFYYNWGEPWYAGFRESQTLMRFKNQVIYERNFIPRMLGWFSIRPNTSIEDAEWLLARAAGFDAGFALAISHDSTAQLSASKSTIEEMKQRGATEMILNAIKVWESARIADAFPLEIRTALCDNNREFHLELIKPNKWNLFERHLIKRKLDKDHPSEKIEWNNSDPEQFLNLMVSANGKKPISGLDILVNGQKIKDLESQMEPGYTLKCIQGNYGIYFDESWKELKHVTISKELTKIFKGKNEFIISIEPNEQSMAQIELWTLSEPKVITTK